ncbi:hypothetical protein FJN13_16215 [Alteromonas mediterranea]|uniref:hypothetical protein n=1 Tax=Alteromonas mediterranea TaxID=314275 RepID=UPI001132395B|nr:hypothetical protein [Alteromonas mediterranea]QDG36257.1 hypothetical protein FJN13_16215 [Alteromonas mediterranea]
MKKLFIHIGPHKTGSTYIQKNLSENRNELNKSGITYPERLIGPQWGHHKLVERIRARDSNDIIDLFAKAEEHVFLSSENFEDLAEDDIEFFKSLLADYSVEIIFFKRSYSKLLVSAWQESVKQGESGNWSEFLLTHTLKPFRSQILNSSSVIEKWEKIADKVHVFDYDAILHQGLDIVKAMCDKVLGVNIPVTPSSVNKSMHLADIELIRILNHRYQNKTGRHPRTIIRDAYLKLKADKNESVISAFELVEKSSNIQSFDDSWVISFFEKRFAYMGNMYFQQNIKSKSSYSLPDNNTFLVGELVEKIKDIENKLCL